MILLEVGNLAGLIILVYLVAHLPAIILLIIGLTRLKTKPKSARVMLIIAGIYFIVGTGTCGLLLS